MDRTYRWLQLANYGLAAACAVLCVATLALGRGAVAVAFLVAAVWWAAVGWFWGTRRGWDGERPAARSWPEPFESVDEDTAFGLESELQRELGMSHPLWGRRAIAVARSTASDDVLFSLPDRGELAVVHLTWLGKRERSGYPSSTTYPSAEAFTAAAAGDPW